MTKTKITEFYMPIVQCKEGETFLHAQNGIPMKFDVIDEQVEKGLKHMAESLNIEIKLYKFTRNIVKTIKPRGVL
jgi:hypothetical protein